MTYALHAKSFPKRLSSSLIGSVLVIFRGI